MHSWQQRSSMRSTAAAAKGPAPGRGRPQLGTAARRQRQAGCACGVLLHHRRSIGSRSACVAGVCRHPQASHRGQSDAHTQRQRLLLLAVGEAQGEALVEPAHAVGGWMDGWMGGRVHG